MTPVIHKTKKSALAVFSFLLLTACSSPEETAQKHLQNGKDFLNKGDLDKARLELMTSTQDIKLGESFYYLALVDEKQNNFKAMHDDLQKSLELDASRIEARIKLAQLELSSGNMSEAAKQLDAVLLGSPDNLTAQILQASLYNRQGKFPDADNILHNVLLAAPDNTDALEVKAEGLYRRNLVPQALAVLTDGLAHHPDAENLYRLKSLIDIHLHNIPAIIQDYKELIRLEPANDGYKIQLASVYSRTSQLAEAEAVLKDRVENAPDKVDNKLLLLKFLNNYGKERVVTEYQNWQADKNLPVSQLIEICRWMLGNGYSDNVAAILWQINANEQDSASGLAALALLAEIPLRTKQYAEAEQALDSILARHPDNFDALILKARTYLAQNKIDEAVAVLNALLATKQKADDVHAYLGLAYLQKKDMKQADQHFKQALEINPAHNLAFFPVYNSLLQTNQKEIAYRLLYRALSANPYEELLLFSKAELELQNKNWSEAANTVNLLAMMAQNRLTVGYLQSTVLLGTQSYANAIDYCQQILAIAPDHKKCMANIASAYTALHQPEKAISFLEAHHAKFPTNLGAVSVLSELFAVSKDYGGLDRLLTEQINISPKVVSLYVDLGIVSMLERKKPETVKEILLKGLANNPEDYQLSMALAAWYQQYDDTKNASSLYEAIIAKHPDADIAVNNLVSILLDSVNAEDQAKGVAMAEKFKGATIPDLVDTYAWSLIKSERTEDGIKLLESLIAHLPDFAPARYHLALVDVQTGNRPLAIKELKQAIAIAEKQHREFEGLLKARKLLQELEAAAKK